ncbi:MAG: TrmB family transcriptional regulator [Candidatus Thorarchaeota archaeon]
MDTSLIIDKTTLNNQGEELILKDLEALGLTTNEARVYYTILPLGSTTASNLVNKTGIPDSKIYRFLSKLEEKGLIRIQDGKPKEYVPLSPSEGLKHLENRISEQYNEKLLTIERLNVTLSSRCVEVEDAPKLAYIIKGEANIINQARELIMKAKKSIMLMVPTLEIYSRIKNSIEDLPGNVPRTLGMYHSNIQPSEDSTPFMPLNCLCFFLIVDDAILLTVSHWKANNWHAILSNETSLVEVSSGYFSSSACCKVEDKTCP